MLTMRYFENYKEHYINKSGTTMDNYEIAVKQYYDFMESKGARTEEEVIQRSTWSEVTMFRNYLVQKGLNPYSINMRLSSLRSFFKFLVLSHIISENPAEKVESLGTEGVEQNRDFLTEQEYLTLIRTIKTRSGKKQDKFEFTSSRDAFMVGIMIVGGLRISEVLSLKVDQINSETKSVTVLGKGRKLRTVPLNTSVINLMNEYLAERDKVETESDLLFLNIKGKGLTRQGTNQNIKKYCERCGIEKDITNHSLRHSALTSMIERGVDVARVQVIAGHTDSKTTSRYYAGHLSTDVDENMLPSLEF